MPSNRVAPDGGADRGAVHCSSRWWYWVAALPVVVAFWVVTSLWLAVSVGLTFRGADLFVGTGRLAVLVPAVALGVPALALFAALPLALWRDGVATRRAGAGWPDLPAAWGGVALLVDAVLAVGVLVLFEAAVTTGLAIVVVAVAAGTGLAVTYLRQRARRVWMPGDLRELKHELRAH